MNDQMIKVIIKIISGHYFCVKGGVPRQLTPGWMNGLVVRIKH